jgi:hypothetical protein
MPEISFWRDLGRRFLLLHEEDSNRLAAHWNSVPCTAAGDHWYLDGGGSESVRRRFQTLAESAAIELGHSEEASALFFWLDLLRKGSPYYNGGGISQGPMVDGEENISEFGHVAFVCAASSEFCTKCETRAVLRSRAAKDARAPATSASCIEPKLGSELPIPHVTTVGGTALDATKLLQLGESFRKAGEQFKLASGRLRAEFITLPNREAWGIWKLRPNTKETESAREKFGFVSTLALQDFGIAPIPAPQAHEFNPNWSEEARPFVGLDGSEPTPSGLNEVDPCTRAWLHFLRIEAEKNDSLAFKVWDGGLTIPNVWEASAVQCERSAREQIETRLRKTKLDQEKLLSATATKPSSIPESPLAVAIRLFESQHEFSRCQIWMRSRINAIELSLTSAATALGTTARLEFALGMLDVRAEAFLQLVTCIDIQNAYELVLSSIQREGWRDFTGHYPENLQPISPTSESAAQKIDRRVRYWVGRGYELVTLLDQYSAVAATNAEAISSVAVCPSIVPGQTQAPELFPSEEQACSWLSQHNPKGLPIQNSGGNTKTGVDAEIAVGQLTPNWGERQADPIALESLVDVASHNERWRSPIPVRPLADYDLKVPFEGSIRTFLPLTITRLPEGPSLDATIDRFFKGESPEIVCCLGDDWGFDKIALSRRVRLGRYNLVEQTGMIGMGFQLAWDLEASLKSRFPKLPAAAVADFWRSWQTDKYLADFCYELGQSEAAIAHLKSPEIAESAAKKIHYFLVTQVAAFAQSVADGNLVNPMQANGFAPADALKPSGESATGNAIDKNDPRSWSPAVQRCEVHRTAPMDSCEGSDFWRKLRSEFDRLSELQRAALGANRENSKWLQGLVKYVIESGYYHCILNGGFDLALVSGFKDLATQAAIALACPTDADPVQFWLQCMCQDIRSQPVQTELWLSIEGGGVIHDVLASSAAYCIRLATLADTRRYKEKTRDNSRASEATEISPKDVTSDPFAYEKLPNDDPNYAALKRVTLKMLSESQDVIARGSAGEVSVADFVEGLLVRFSDGVQMQIDFEDGAPISERCTEVERLAQAYLREVTAALNSQTERLGAEYVGSAIDYFSTGINKRAARGKKEIIDAERERDLAKEKATAFQTQDGTAGDERRDEVHPAKIRRKPGRPAKIPIERKRDAVLARTNHASWKEIAKILYGTSYPTSAQVKNSPNVLKHFQRAASPST